jgi:RHS repeat-associated protein
VTGVTAPGGVTHAFAYDGTLALSETIGGPVPGTVAWTYDNDFRIASQSVNGGNTVTFAYDADSLLTGAGALAIARDAQNGLVTGTTLGSVSDAWTYNGHAEPVDYQASFAGVPVYRAQMLRDALGRVTQKTETIGGVTDTHVYTYDLAGRLAGVVRNGTPTSYAYDANSNRTATSGPLANVAAAVYDAQDRLLQYGAVAYTYDRHGDLSSRTQAGATTQYGYDEFGNLTRVVLPGGTQIDYVIDGMNRRIAKKVDGTLVRRWLYDGRLRIVAELDGAGTLVSRFVYAEGVNLPAYVVQGATTLRLIGDPLGSPRLLIDAASGAIVGSMNHDAYGRVLQDTLSSSIPFGFAGGHYDAQTALVRFGARDYDAETGRWLAKDPVRFAAPGANLYVYSLADPVNLADPTGLESYDVYTLAAGVIAIQTRPPGNVAPHWQTPRIQGSNTVYLQRGGVKWVLLPEMVLSPGDEIVLEDPCDEVMLLLWDHNTIRIKGGNRVRIVDPSPGTWHPVRDLNLFSNRDLDAFSQETRRQQKLEQDYVLNPTTREPVLRRMPGPLPFVGTKG